jgi:hypothetical protein
VACLHHYTGIWRLAHFGQNFVINFVKCYVFLCVVTLSAGWPLVSLRVHVGKEIRPRPGPNLLPKVFTFPQA